MDEDASVGEAFAIQKVFHKVSANRYKWLKGFRQSFQKVYAERIKNGSVESDVD